MSKIIGIGLLVVSVAILGIVGAVKLGSFAKRADAPVAQLAPVLPVQVSRPDVSNLVAKPGPGIDRPTLVSQLADEYANSKQLDPARQRLAEWTTGEKVNALALAYTIAWQAMDNPRLNRVGQLAQAMKFAEAWDMDEAGVEMVSLLRRCVGTSDTPAACLGLISFGEYVNIPRSAWCVSDLATIFSCKARSK